MKPVDVAVVGAGVFGAWTAYHLRRAGYSVMLVDAYGAANNRASSGGETRIIRMGYGADEIYTRSSMRSLTLWQEFFREVRQPLFHRTGVLWICGADDPYALGTRQTLERCAVDFELLGPEELARRYPQMCCPEGAWAILEPDSGALMARRAVQAVVAEARRHGVSWATVPVAPPAGGGRLDTIAGRDGETIAASTFVFACGAWLPKLFPALLGRRIFPTRQEVFFFGVPAGDRHFAPPQLPVWAHFSDQRQPYGFPDLDNRGVKIALDRHGPPFDPDRGNRLPSEEGAQAARNCLAALFPALAEAPVLEARVCQYENTSTGDFLIDRHPDFENVWLVGGGSGHGFKHGPAVGEYVTARIAGTAEPAPRYLLAGKAEVQRRAVF